MVDAKWTSGISQLQNVTEENINSYIFNGHILNKLSHPFSLYSLEIEEILTLLFMYSN